MTYLVLDCKNVMYPYKMNKYNAFVAFLDTEGHFTLPYYYNCNQTRQTKVRLSVLAISPSDRDSCTRQVGEVSCSRTQDGASARFGPMR